jgi:hypothetical protein
LEDSASEYKWCGHGKTDLAIINFRFNFKLQSFVTLANCIGGISETLTLRLDLKKQYPVRTSYNIFTKMCLAMVLTGYLRKGKHESFTTLK